MVLLVSLSNSLDRVATLLYFTPNLSANYLKFLVLIACIFFKSSELFFFFLGVKCLLFY